MVQRMHVCASAHTHTEVKGHLCELVSVLLCLYVCFGTQIQVSRVVCPKHLEPSCQPFKAYLKHSIGPCCSGSFTRWQTSGVEDFMQCLRVQVTETGSWNPPTSSVAWRKLLAFWSSVTLGKMALWHTCWCWVGSVNVSYRVSLLFPTTSIP